MADLLASWNAPGARRGKQSAPVNVVQAAGETRFIAMMSDEVTWLRACEPQHNAARAAEYIRLLEPGREVGELEAAA